MCKIGGLTLQIQFIYLLTTTYFLFILLYTGPILHFSLETITFQTIMFKNNATHNIFDLFLKNTTHHKRFKQTFLDCDSLRVEKNRNV